MTAARSGIGSVTHENSGEGSMRRLRRIAAVCGACVLLLSGAPAGRGLAADGQPERRGHAPIAWVGAVCTNVIYLPLKAVYAGTGGIGLAGLTIQGRLSQYLSHFCFLHIAARHGRTATRFPGYRFFTSFANDTVWSSFTVNR